MPLGGDQIHDRLQGGVHQFYYQEEPSQRQEEQSGFTGEGKKEEEEALEGHQEEILPEGGLMAKSGLQSLGAILGGGEEMVEALEFGRDAFLGRRSFPRLFLFLVHGFSPYFFFRTKRYMS